jgi:hypothetical protein
MRPALQRSEKRTQIHNTWSQQVLRRFFQNYKKGGDYETHAGFGAANGRAIDIV